MKKVLIITHGTLAEGFASSIKVLLGKDDVNFINAYVDDNNKDYTNEIKSFLNEIDDDDEAIIFTDIFGGSVNQKVVRLVNESSKNIFIVTQVNLPIILELLLTNETLSDELIKKMIDSSPVRLVEIENLTTSNNNETDFFE